MQKSQCKKPLPPHSLIPGFSDNERQCIPGIFNNSGLVFFMPRVETVSRDLVCVPGRTLNSSMQWPTVLFSGARPGHYQCFSQDHNEWRCGRIYLLSRSSFPWANEFFNIIRKSFTYWPWDKNVRNLLRVLSVFCHNTKMMGSSGSQFSPDKRERIRSGERGCWSPSLKVQARYCKIVCLYVFIRENGAKCHHRRTI
jgi:hypothetical protein